MTHSPHIHRKRLQEIIVRAVNAKRAGTHIFTRGHNKYLPEFNLPEELENNPVTKTPKAPITAAGYLYTEAYFEKKVRAPHIIKRARGAWNKHRWIFDPCTVADAHLADIEEIFATSLNFGMNHFENVRHPPSDLEERRKPSVIAAMRAQLTLDGIYQKITKDSHDQSRPEQYQDNARHLVRHYDGDPRRLIDGCSVTEARTRIMQLGGFGTGLANLLISYYMNRDLATVTDPQNVLPKVDVHKGRIPINTNAVTFDPALTTISRETMVDMLQPAYRKACQKLDIPTHEADSALWILGSEVCAQRDYSECANFCPVYDLCDVNTPTSDASGTYLLRDTTGKRIDSRTKGLSTINVKNTHDDMFKEKKI